MMSKLKRIMVTGGAGFLGATLCKNLVDERNFVVCVDNLLTGSSVNLADLESNKNFEFLEHDITNPFSIEVDEIYNLACAASPIHYQADPVHTIKTSVLGAINALELARELDIKIFQASTSEVYGDPEEHPQKETYWGNVNPIGYRACYDEGKRCAEALFFDYHRQYNVKIKIGRIFNTYGPGMDPSDGRVVSNFILQALLGQPITIYGDGSQTRSFCYVDDLIIGIRSVMDSDEHLCGPFNIGNPYEFSILELATAVLDLTNSRSKMVFEPLPSDDPIRRQPDLENTKNCVGWQPTTALFDGLKKTIPYFERLLTEGADHKVWRPK
jgi:UDP-glucuronate decarboxylase